jgi:hypothetical protein
MTVNDLITTSNPYTLSLTGTGNEFAENVEFLNTGTVTIGNATSDTFLFSSGLSFSGNSASNLAATIRSIGEVINFGTGGVTLVQNSTVDTTNSGGTAAGATITFGSTLTGTAAGVQTLGLTAGTAGNVVFTGAAGTTRLGAITINSANDVTAAAITAASLVQTTGNGTTTFSGAQNYNTALGLNVVTDTIALNAAVTTTGSGIVTLNANNNNAGAGVGTLTIGAGGDITSDGNITFIGRLGITTSGDVTAVSDNLTLGDASQTGAITQSAGTMTIGGDTSIRTTGNVSLVSSSNDFTGVLTVQNANGITLRDANDLRIGATSTTGGQVFVAAGDVTSTGLKTTPGNMLIQSTDGSVTLNTGSSYSSNLTQIVVGEGQSFITDVGASAFTGVSQIFTDSATQNSPSSANAGLTGFTPTYDVTPVVTISSTPGVYSLVNSTGATPSGNVVTYLPIPVSSEVYTDAELNQILTTDANLTTIPVASAAASMYLPTRDPVVFGAVIPEKPAARDSGTEAPIRISFRGVKEKKL